MYSIYCIYLEARLIKKFSSPDLKQLSRAILGWFLLSPLELVSESSYVRSRIVRAARVHLRIHTRALHYKHSRAHSVRKGQHAPSVYIHTHCIF